MIKHISICACFVLACLGLTQAASFEEQLNTLFIRHYNGTTINEYEDVLLSDIEALKNILDPRKNFTIFLHGWDQNVESDSVVVVAEAYLKAKRDTYNFYAIDYRVFSNTDYVDAAFSLNYVGNRIALNIGKAIEHNSDNMHLIGHSLGAQLAGAVGRKANFKIPRITGLDPAGPLFTLIEPHLSKSDALFVDIIHTDKGFYGSLLISGHVDFYPNGGHRVQPGCKNFTTLFDSDDYCSHHQSYIFYAQSVINEEIFISSQCKSEISFNNGYCNDHFKIPMGFKTPVDARGKFYLRTSASDPLGLGEAGALSD